MRSLVLLFAIAAFASSLPLISGCENKEIVYLPTAPDGDDDEPTFDRGAFVPDPALVGSWLLEEGTLMPEVDPALRATAIEVEQNGHAHVYFRDLYTNAIDCVRAFLLFDGERIALDLSREPNSIYYNPERAMFFPLVVLDGNFLGMADENSGIALFSRQTVLPQDVICGSLSFAVSYGNLPAPQYFSDLVHYLGDMVYSSSVSNQIERFDLATLALEAPVSSSVVRYVQTSHTGNTLWQHCGCGGTPGISRSNFTTTFDDVHTLNDLNWETTIRAAAYVPSTARLWLHGRRFDQAYSYFIEVNPNVEPDTRDATYGFNREVRALSHDGNNFWAIVRIIGTKICRIDPATMQVTGSFALPDEDVSWSGLEFDPDGNMWLLGTDLNGQGVLTHMTVASSVPKS